MSAACEELLSCRCGMRCAIFVFSLPPGGVLHMTNIDPDVADQIYKLFSMILCANTLGQAGQAADSCDCDRSA